MTTHLMLVLHGHIPDVMGHGTWPHGANWVYEAAAETYLPFLDVVERLLDDGVPVKATIGMTPVLAEQLQDPRFVDGFMRYLGQRANAAARDRLAMRMDGDETGAALAEAWKRFYRARRDQFLALPERDIIGAFRRLAELGLIEPIASAATHGFLPLLPNDRAIDRQLDVGLAAHARHFGRSAAGIWLPECAYRPAGPWVSPAGDREEVRRGIEDFLAERGVKFFFVETHLVQGGEMRPAYGGRASRPDSGGSPYLVNAVQATDGSVISVFARDPLSSEQVWSGHVGYPGDGRYLEFHKQKAHRGHRYWRVTDSKLDLHEKEPYDPTAVPAVLRSHADHFVSMLEDMEPWTDGTPALVVAMFDFELFGHWWFEGPEFLGEVFRRLTTSTKVKPMTASEAIAATPPRRVIRMPHGTWGRNGDFQVWWNEHTVDYWRLVESVERRMELFEDRAREGELDQELFEAMERQTLLLQSSDWPFLIDNEVSRDYAEERIREHVKEFTRLARMAERGRVNRKELERLERRDSLFGPELRGRMAL